MERRDEFKTHFACDLPETVGQPTQIRMRNPGDELAVSAFLSRRRGSAWIVVAAVLSAIGK
jgi:hypothetical protein